MKLSRIPCATCGRLPDGLMFHTAEQLERLGPDWFRRYDCSHPPFTIRDGGPWRGPTLAEWVGRFK